MTQVSAIIRNAWIVDGSGGPAFEGSVAIAGDRIVGVGALDGLETGGAREIDAGGHVLAPGFIDVHTHYDPQLCWDGMATPSPEHGVTTIVAGNCSLSLAPVKPEGRDKITRLFGTVEDFAPTLFETAVPYSWTTFRDYLDHVRPNLGPNVGILVGHSALRLFVMGAAAQERVATDDEIAQMKAILKQAMLDGAIGFSMTYGHIDEKGDPLPCHYADRREKLALCQALAEAGRGVLEVAPNFSDIKNIPLLIDELGSLALETGITCSMSPILHSSLFGDAWLRQLMRLEQWQARGARVFAQTQTRPLDQTFRLSRGSVVLTKYKTWGGIINLPLAERKTALADRSVWPILDEELIPARGFFDAVVIKRTEDPLNKPYEGRHLVKVAEELGRPLADVFIEIALRDDLETEFEVTGLIHSDPVIVSLLLSHPAMQIGSADAGAHIAQFAGAGDTCYLFQRFVRELGYFSVEQAVRRLTRDLAEGWHIADRGQIGVGKFADLVLFDPDTIARGPEQWVQDLPDGGGRYIRNAAGIDMVMVNGEVVVERGAYTNARPGRIV